MSHNDMINRTKFLEPKELETLKSQLSLSSRDGVLITFALASGARASEILNLEPKDLFLDTNTVFIRGLKGGRDRELPVKPELMVALQKYVPFNIGYRRLEQIWRMYRPAPKKFHSLRHTFAVNLLKRTKDIKLVQLALGHKSIVNTSIYTDFLYERDQMSRILE